MKCRYCNSKNTRVICTNHFDRYTKRYCKCLNCNAKFRTVEKYELPKPGPLPGCFSQTKGQANGRSVFKESDIRMMRLLRLQGKTVKSIAEKYGISTSYTSEILNGKAWSHIT